MPTPCTLFSLQVTLGYGCSKASEAALNKACALPTNYPSLVGIASSFFGSGKKHQGSGKHSKGNSQANANNGKNNSDSRDRLFVASASAVQVQVTSDQGAGAAGAAGGGGKTGPNTICIAAFVPPDIVDRSLQKMTTSEPKAHASGSSYWMAGKTSARLDEDLLPEIHSALVNCSIRGIVLTSVAAEHNAPAEIVLIDLPKGMQPNDILQLTNGEAISSNPDSILKLLPLASVHFTLDPTSKVASLKGPPLDIPCCAVCLHRINPVRLGLPSPPKKHLCSKFCPTPDIMRWSRGNINNARSAVGGSCPRQRLLQRWPPPSRCRACQIIEHYWSRVGNGRDGENFDDGDHDGLFCECCAINKTLWVCLTCGFVGCGRYSNKHSVEHFQETNHPYSLELATLRIWDYVYGDHGGYAHRADLLECPSSLPLRHPWLVRSAMPPMTQSAYPPGSYAYGAFGLDVEKSPKKATMIGEEYEALLQSALEDQAQHYEGEIARLRAELTASIVDQGSMTMEEQREIDSFKADIDQLRKDIEESGRQLLDTQAQEAGYRATSQRLLSEQQEANEVLKTIQEEARRENERGKLQVEDLEQQVRDLTTNLRMRQQFSQSEELSEAQIFGTTTSTGENTKQGKRGKKKGRYFRK